MRKWYRLILIVASLLVTICLSICLYYANDMNKVISKYKLELMDNNGVEVHILNNNQLCIYTVYGELSEENNFSKCSLSPIINRNIESISLNMPEYPNSEMAGYGINPISAKLDYVVFKTPDSLMGIYNIFEGEVLLDSTEIGSCAVKGNSTECNEIQLARIGEIEEEYSNFVEQSGVSSRDLVLFLRQFYYNHYNN